MNTETHQVQFNTKISLLPLEVTEPQTVAGGEFLCRFSKNKTKILISGYLSFWQMLQKRQIHSVRNVEDRTYQTTRENFSYIWLLFSATVKPSRNGIIVSIYYKSRFFFKFINFFKQFFLCPWLLQHPFQQDRESSTNLWHGVDFRFKLH